MGYRLKFLVFLSVFLIGAFSIITWKAFRVYSESYAETAVQGEMDILEERVRSIAGDFERFKVLASGKGDVEAQMKALQIPLMAHVVFAEGKWKAQWFEGVTGMREQAKALASQIAFDSTPQSRNSWALVRFQDRSTGYAFIIPSISDASVHFFAYFLDQKGLAQVLKKNSVVESLHIISPQAGEIYSSQQKDMRLIDGQLKNLSGKTQGLLVTKASNRVALYQFHPFLQSYIFKVIPQAKVASLPLARFYGLIFFALLLCGIAVYAMHILFVALFERLQAASEKIRKTMNVETLPRGRDELTVIEFLAEVAEQQAPALASARTSAAETTPAIITNTIAAIQEPVTAPSDDTTSMLRSRVINCLGYLNRIKTQFQIDSPHIRLLEQELRELRKAIDPQRDATATASIQPAFNPILSSYQKELADDKKDANAKITESAKTPVASATEVMSTVRRPKREINDFGDL